MERGEQFVALFNKLDAHLRSLLRKHRPELDHITSFSAVVRQLSQFNATVKRRKDDLVPFVELRNVLVHTSGRKGVRILAEPLPEVLLEFQTLVEGIMQPRRVDSIGSKNLRLFSSTSQLEDALRYMREQDFSQVVVEAQESVTVMTTTGIANWLEQHLGDGIVMLEGTLLSEVLEHEPPGSFRVVARDAVVDDVRQHFLSLPASDVERLHAVVITHSGRDSEKPIGIVTPWDMFDQS